MQWRVIPRNSEVVIEDEDGNYVTTSVDKATALQIVEDHNKLQSVADENKIDPSKVKWVSGIAWKRK